MANVKIGWGRCLISGGTAAHAATTQFRPDTAGVITPIEGTAQLTTQEGERLEAKFEGGEIAAIRYGADTYVLEFAVWTKDAGKTAADALKNYPYIYIVPEDASVYQDTYTLNGVQLVKSTITGNSSDGFRTNYRIEANRIA